MGEEGTQEGVVYTHSTLSSLCSAEVVSLAGGSAELSQVAHDTHALGSVRQGIFMVLSTRKELPDYYQIRETHQPQEDKSA